MMQRDLNPYGYCDIGLETTSSCSLIATTNSAEGIEPS